MREYIFHGKSKATEEWAEGYYVKAEKLDKSGYEYFIIEEGAEGASHLVYPESIGQWTGLCDKKGRKIFEGDIISIMFETDGVDGFPGYSWYESAAVVFSEEKHAWIIVFDDGGEEMYLSEYDDVDDVYVIATAFDNVDLLEE